jgi:DNA primase
MNFREWTEKIRDANPIDEVVEERGIEVRKVSQGRVCLCPLPGHYDTRPSFSISADGRCFFCFGCERSGDVFTLVELLDGIDFLTARKKLAKRVGIVLLTAPKRGPHRGR